MPSPKKVGDVRAYRSDQQEKVTRILTILAGDPEVTDPHNPDNYRNSLVGRIDRTQEDLADLRKDTGEAITLLKQAVQDLRTEVRDNTFGWAQVNDFVRKHIWKLLGILAAGLFYLHDRNALPFWPK